MLVVSGMMTAGKDTVFHILVNKYGMVPLVRYTSRPMREGEIEGKHYHYTDNAWFEQMIEKGLLAEYEKFETKEDTKPWYYGSLKSDYGQDVVTIMSPIGIKMLKESQLEDDVLIVQLYVPESIILERVKERNWSTAEVERRLHEDAERFEKFKSFVDYCVPSYTTLYTPEKVTVVIYEWYKAEMNKRLSKEAI